MYTVAASQSINLIPCSLANVSNHVCVCACHILFLFHTVVTIGLVPDPTAGTPDYEIPESTSPFQFCAQMTSNSLIDPAKMITVDLTTQPAGAQGLCNNFDPMIGSLLMTSHL